MFLSVAGARVHAMAFCIQHVVICAAVCSTANHAMTSVYVSTPSRIWYEHWLYDGEWKNWLSTPPSTRLFRRHVPFYEVFGAFLLGRLQDCFLPGLFYELLLYSDDTTWRVCDVFIRSPKIYGHAGLWRQYSQDEDLSYWYDFVAIGNYCRTFWEVVSQLPAPAFLSVHFDYEVARAMFRGGLMHGSIDRYFDVRNTHYSASRNFWCYGVRVADVVFY